MFADCWAQKLRQKSEGDGPGQTLASASKTQNDVEQERDALGFRPSFIAVELLLNLHFLICKMAIMVRQRLIKRDRAWEVALHTVQCCKEPTVVSVVGTPSPLMCAMPQTLLSREPSGCPSKAQTMRHPGGSLSQMGTWDGKGDLWMA